MFKKKANIIFLVIFLVLIVAIVVITLFLIFIPNQPSLSQCHTDLQPSNYFNIEDIHNIIKPIPKIVIDSKGDEFSYGGVKNTGSMRPSISDDSILIMIKPKQEELNIGDIIVIRKNETFTVVHRIINIKEEEGESVYILKGDNNAIEDSKTYKFEDVDFKIVGVLY